MGVEPTLGGFKAELELFLVPSWSYWLYRSYLLDQPAPGAGDGGFLGVSFEWLTSIIIDIPYLNPIFLRRKRHPKAKFTVRQEVNS